MLDLLTECDVAQRLHVSLASLRRWRLERRGPRFIEVRCLVRYRIVTHCIIRRFVELTHMSRTR